MTLTNKLKTVRDALLQTSGNVFHYTKGTNAGKRYIVWQESEESSSANMNNRKTEQEIHGTVDLFTCIEFDSLADEIQTALNAADRIAWRLNSTQYEDDTELIHYEWEFWVH